MVNRQTLLFFLLGSVLMLGSLLPAVATASEDAQPVKIGVLAYRGKETALSMWTPTAQYLTRAIPARAFTVVPLDFDEINAAVASGGGRLRHCQFFHLYRA